MATPKSTVSDLPVMDDCPAPGCDAVVVWFKAPSGRYVAIDEENCRGDTELDLHRHRPHALTCQSDAAKTIREAHDRSAIDNDIHSTLYRLAALVHLLYLAGTSDAELDNAHVGFLAAEMQEDVAKVLSLIDELRPASETSPAERDALQRLEALGQDYELFRRLRSHGKRTGEYVVFSAGDFADRGTLPELVRNAESIAAEQTAELAGGAK